MTKEETRIVARVTQKEKERINDFAKICGLSTTEYIRQRALGFEPRLVPPNALFVFCEKLDAIAGLLAEVEPYEQGRVEKIKARIEANLEQLSAATQQAIDRNRLEQEMIYYIEKLDINEEKVRLTNHVRYFRETMEAEGTGVGKKLGFIAQEMGREINTLGSKANQSEMQIIVVKMKDILEQIKEQVLNVL